ncbi:MAG: CatB-related O-acetyltransferase [Pseudomonadota bacterium]
MIKKIHNKKPDAIKELTTYGVHHNLSDKVVSRFYGTIETPVRISECRIFHDFSIGAFTYLSGGFFYHTHIGRYGSFANGLHIGQGNHPIDWLSTHPFQYQPMKYAVGAGFRDRDIYFEDADKADNSIVTKPERTTIGHDVWIGYGAYIRNGVTIGDGAVIGARSIVTKDVPPYAVVVGHPAKVVKYRFDEKIIGRLMAVKWWRFAPWQLRDFDFSKIETIVGQLEDFVATSPEEYVPGQIDLHR